MKITIQELFSLYTLVLQPQGIVTFDGPAVTQIASNRIALSPLINWAIEERNRIATKCNPNAVTESGVDINKFTTKQRSQYDEEINKLLRQEVEAPLYKFSKDNIRGDVDTVVQVMQAARPLLTDYPEVATVPVQSQSEALH